MHSLRLITFFLLLTSTAFCAQTPSANSLLLTEKLRLTEFGRFFKTPGGISAIQAADLEARFGLKPLIDHLALHFDHSYTPEQIKGMLALWDYPHMQLLVKELIGVEAPINRLLAEWMQARLHHIQTLRPAPKPTQ